MILAGAIDIGGTNTRVALVNKYGEIIKRKQFITPILGKPEDIACKGTTVLQDLAGDDFSCLDRYRSCCRRTAGSDIRRPDKTSQYTI